MFGSSIIHITWINIVIYFVAAWNISSIIFLSLAACFHTCPAQQPNWLCVLPPALHHRDKPIAYQAARLHGDGGSFSDWPGEKEVGYESKFMNRCVLRLIIVAFFHVWSMCVCIHVCIYLCTILYALINNIIIEKIFYLNLNQLEQLKSIKNMVSWDDKHGFFRANL